MASPAAKAQRILVSVKDDIEGADTTNVDDDSLAQKLEELKILARVPEQAREVYQTSGMKLLARCAFDTHDLSRSTVESASIIANALLLKPETQEIFAQLGYNEAVVKFYSTDEVKHEFVGARILFLLTFNSTINFSDLIARTDLAKSIFSHLEQHRKRISQGTFDRERMNHIALMETAKLLYSLGSKCPDKLSEFTLCSAPLSKMLTTMPPYGTVLEPLPSTLLNALAVVEWSTTMDTETLYQLTDKLLPVLDSNTQSSQTQNASSQLEVKLVPLVTVLRRVIQTADSACVQLLRTRLLPADSERDKPLGRSNTLAARLLQLQTYPGLINLSEAVSGLLFELSDRDATVFIHNVGYGHAAGYLMTHQIPIPEGVHAGTFRDGVANGSVLVNPVTGQRIDAEPAINVPEMTDAEKEREAERLFVLFERLRQTGVVNVENPVTAAKRSGRFEEVLDENDEDNVEPNR